MNLVYLNLVPQKIKDEGIHAFLETLNKYSSVVDVKKKEVLATQLLL